MTVPNLLSLFSLSDLPEGLATSLGIGDFEAGILMSVILLLVVLTPFFILTLRARSTAIMPISFIIGFSILGFETAIGWFPIWIMIIMCFIVALLFASKFTEKF